MSELVLAVDNGTTGTTVIVTTPVGTIVGRGYREHPQRFPAPGLVEHDPVAIWQSVLDAAKEAIAAASIKPGDIAAVGITNQRETIVPWSSVDGRPIGPTIVWQDRRTTDRCAALRAAGDDHRIRELTGLPTDPYFSATKIEWLLEHDDVVRSAANAGTLRLGTIDSWLAYQMSGGAAHITDASNAARTMLYDIHAGSWSGELTAKFGVDQQWLPTVTDCSGRLAQTDPDAFLGISAPIAGMAGDQQSALFGQACIELGQAKATYGTGAFVLVNSGASAPVTEALISTVAWQLGGEITYTLEGSVFTAGASVQWLRDGLEIVATAPETEAMALSVPDSGGVVVVPAFAGLGAPIWDATARGAVLGLTRGSTRAHVARATLEAVAFRVRQVVGAMQAEGTIVHELRVDGGMAKNRFLLQLQANVLGIPVVRPENVETTSLGAAYLAALGSGLLGSLSEVAEAWKSDLRIEPEPGADVEHDYERFLHAVDAVRQFAASERPAAARRDR